MNSRQRDAQAYLPPCTQTKNCGCAYLVPTRGANRHVHIELPAGELVRITTSTYRVQVRIRCLEHGDVGAVLPHRALVGSELINASHLPERHPKPQFRPTTIHIAQSKP
jgi:hypothetical protein